MFEHIQLPNPGLTRGMIPPEIYQPVMQEIKEIERNDAGIMKMNKTLAGQIEREYQKKWDCFTGTGARPKKDLKVDSLWVNLQQKTEYNPIHNHDGVLSYVAWLEVPYKHENEVNLKQSRDSRTKEFSASFQFIYSSIIGNIVNEIYKVENGWEGRIVMFPAKLLHIVYPFFTSDGYRISIAGNLS